MRSSILLIAAVFTVGLLFALVLFSAAMPIAHANDDHDHHKRRGKSRYSFFRHGGEDEGNELTGQSAAWIFAAANLPVAFSLLLKGFTRFVHLRDESKSKIKRFNRNQKKYLMRLHFFLNPLALMIALVHFSLSSCRSSSLPEWGLTAAVALALMGMMIKFKIPPTAIRKRFYSLHTSPLIFGLILGVLVIGHSIVD